MAHILSVDLQVHHIQPSLLYYDNQSVIQIALNQVFHEHTKHIKIDYHIIEKNFIKVLLNFCLFV